MGSRKPKVVVRVIALVPSATDQRTPVCPTCVGILDSRGIHCPACGIKLPDHLAVHRFVIVAIKKREYFKLPEARAHPIDIAYAKVKRGRQSRKLVWGDQTLIELTIEDPELASTIVDLRQLEEAIAEEGCGRVTVDPYELNLFAILWAKENESKEVE